MFGEEKFFKEGEMIRNDVLILPKLPSINTKIINKTMTRIIISLHLCGTLPALLDFPLGILLQNSLVYDLSDCFVDIL